MQRIILILFILFCSSNANAIPISDSNGITYNITTFSNSLGNANPILIAQPWYANNSLAAELAGNLSDQLGFPNIAPNGNMFGPLFVTGAFSTFVNAFLYDSRGFVGGVGTGLPFQYAIVEPQVSIPEPATMFLLSIGLLGLIFLRKMQPNVL